MNTEMNTEERTPWSNRSTVKLTLSIVKSAVKSQLRQIYVRNRQIYGLATAHLVFIVANPLQQDMLRQFVATHKRRREEEGT